MSFKQLAEKATELLKVPKKSVTACPVCSVERSLENCSAIRESIANMALDESRWFEFFYKGDQGKAFKSLASGDYGWACDSCLDSGLALKADCKKQQYLDWPPYLAYVDETKICKGCSSEFTFTKEEQLYWYEELEFWVQSRAVKCKECRASDRESKAEYVKAQSESKHLEGNLDRTSREQIEKLIACYEKTNSHKKVAYYKEILTKLADDSCPKL